MVQSTSIKIQTRLYYFSDYIILDNYQNFILLCLKFLYFSETLQVCEDTSVCVTAKIIGHVTIGSKTVVHPKAEIIAEDGPIVIGEGNLVEEKARIINK